MSKDYNADFICIVFSVFVLLPVRRYAIAGRGERATCPSVCHTSVLCQNEES